MAASPSVAQWRRPTSGVDGLPVSLAAPEGAFALEANPAALALLPAWEVAVMVADAGDPTLGLYGATTLPFRLAIAAGADWRLRDGQDEGRFSFGAAWARSRTLAVGGALRYLDVQGGRLGALDLGLTWRPRSQFGVGVVVHDLLGPLGLTRSGIAVPGSIRVAAQFRPFGTDQLFAEAAVAADTDGRVGVRGMLGIGVPRVGRLRGVVEAEDLAGDRALRVMATMTLDWGTTSIEGGFARAPGSDGSFGPIGVLRLRGAERRGLPQRGAIDDLEIRGSLGARRLVGLVHRLERDRHDPHVRGVFLRLRATDLGMAHAQEIREVIAALESAGKPVVCHLDAGTGSELYACGPASRTLVDPAGGVRLLGPSFDVMLYGDALAALGIRTDFVRIGRFKSAVEQYANGTSTGPASAQRSALLDDVFARYAQDLGADRGVAPGVVVDWVDGGPYSTPELIERGMIHGEADEFVVTPILSEVMGTSRRSSEPPLRDEATIGNPPRVAVVMIDGSIVDGDNVDYPIIEIHQSGSRTIVRAIEALAADSSVRAIVLRVDSPGGSVLASDQIWRAIRRARARKPVIASMGAVAASGGYYVASACDLIYADPSTITGSIGIFFGKADFSPLAERLGVSVEQVGRGRHAGADSLFRMFTPEERALAADKIRYWYRLFLQRVAEGRGMEVDAIHRLGQGRIWSGDAAQQLGLVDRLGGFAAAIHEARQRGGLDADSEVVMVPARPSSLIEYVLGAVDSPNLSGDAPDVRATPASRRLLDAAAALAASDGAPMALMPMVVDLR